MLQSASVALGSIFSANYRKSAEKLGEIASLRREEYVVQKFFG